MNKDVLLDSLVLITSREPGNPKSACFGTGFVVYHDQDRGVSYIVTCTHVLDEIEERDIPTVAGHSVEVVARGAPNERDLAIVKVRGLVDRPALPLGGPGSDSAPVWIAGYQPSGPAFSCEVVEDYSLAGKTKREAGTASAPVTAWALRQKKSVDPGGPGLDRGFSGSPIVDPATGHVIAVAVVAAPGREGSPGEAIAIQEIKPLWPAELPREQFPALFQARVPSPLSPERASVAPITCLALLPCTEAYQIVFEALRDVLEAPPYFWHVARPNHRFLANNVEENMALWVDRAHCYAVDVSEGDEDVMIALGQISSSYSERPVLLLQREDTSHRSSSLLSARLRITYPWDFPPDREHIAEAFREEIRKFDALEQLEGAAHYLSPRAFQAAWISPKLARALGERYSTVEELLAKDPEVILKDVAPDLGRAGLIQDIQNYLRDLCGLS